MRVYIFKGHRLFWAYTASPDGANLPKAAGPWTFFDTTNVARGDPPHPAFKPDDLLDAIEKKGFYGMTRRITLADARGTDLVK